MKTNDKLNLLSLTLLLFSPAAVHTQQATRSSFVVDFSYDTISISPTVPLYVFEVVDSVDTIPTEYAHLRRYSIHQIGNPTVSQTIEVSGWSIHDFEIVDLNLDGYKDLKIEDDPVNLSAPSEVWLFDPKSHLFEFSDEFSGLSELSINPDDSEITTQELYTGARGGRYCTYRVKNGHLQLIQREDANYDDVKKEVLKDGRLTLVESSGEEQGWIVQRKLIEDSLRIVRKFTKVMEWDATKEQKDNGVEVSDPAGTFYLLREELYDYGTTKTGKKYVGITFHEAKDGAWVTTSQQRQFR